MRKLSIIIGVIFVLVSSVIYAENNGAGALYLRIVAEHTAPRWGSIRSIAFDGKNIWTSQYKKGWNSRIYKHNMDSELSVAESYPSSSPYLTGMTFADGILWTSDNKINRTVQYNVKDVFIKEVGRYPSPGLSVVSGMAYDGEAVWLAQSQSIIKVDCLSGKLLDRYTSKLTSGKGLEWDPQKKCLWVIDEFTGRDKSNKFAKYPKLRQFSFKNGKFSLITEYDLRPYLRPHADGSYSATGLVVVDGDIWTCDSYNNNNRIIQLSFLNKNNIGAKLARKPSPWPDLRNGQSSEGRGGSGDGQEDGYKPRPRRRFFKIISNEPKPPGPSGPPRPPEEMAGVVFVVEWSNALGTREVKVKGELKRMISNLNETDEFTVIFYSSPAGKDKEFLGWAGRGRKLAGPSNKQAAYKFIDNMPPTAVTGTAPYNAIQRALSYNPESINLIATHINFPRRGEGIVNEHGTKINVTYIGPSYLGFKERLEAIAEQNNGTFRYID